MINGEKPVQNKWALHGLMEIEGDVSHDLLLEVRT